MHILMTADTVGGVWTYTRELVSGLVRRGHRVTLISFGRNPSPEQTRWMQGLRGLDYHPTAFRLEWMQDSAEDIQESTALLEQTALEVSPDLLHLNQYAYAALSTSIPKIVVAHSDVVSWWVNVHRSEPPDNVWSRWYRDLVSRGIAGADLVIAPSKWMLDALKTYYTTPTNYAVIYNARTRSLFNPYRVKENCVLAVGRVWDQAKQVSLLWQTTHAIPIYIAGSKDHPEKLVGGHEPCRAPGVILLGEQTQEQLYELYARSAIYCATSCYEPFGLAALEAALSGCTLIANDIPIFHELWDDSACYFRRNDAGSLAARIGMLSRDARLRRHYVERALERAHAMFDVDRMIDFYESAYKRLVAREAYA
jgi:glycogen(starch) synthase